MKFISEFIVFTVLLVALINLVMLAHPNFSHERIMQVIVQNHDDFVRISDPGGAINYNNLRAEPWSLLSNVPLALFSGLFRPFVWEADGLTPLLASFENLLILVLSIAALFKVKHLANSPDRLLIIALLMYTVLLGALLALSAPNFGTLSRYRIGYLPLLMIVLFHQPVVVRMVDRFFGRV